jgi:tRNA(Ile)-lysidine synthase
VLQRSVSTTLPFIRSHPVSQDDKPSPASPVLSALEEFFRAYGGRTLLAVSGGVDSLALLTAAAEVAPERVGVASLDHGLRPTSAGEVEAVRALAASLGLAFHTAQLGLRPGPGMEARARAARYAALETLRAQGGYQWVATAHTRDDQAETLLMRLGRGAALRGAGSIRAQRGPLVRPLLSVGRADVEGHVAARGLVPVRDPSNADLSLLRARIRHGALPALVQAAGPAVVQNLAAFAAHAAEDEELLAEQAALALERARVPGGLDAVAVRSWPGPLQRRALVAWLAEAAVPASARLVAQVQAAVRRGGHCGLPGQRLLRSEGGLLRIAGEVRAATEVALPPDSWVLFGGFRLRLDSSSTPGPAAFPLSREVGPLTVRGRRPGDRVRASGGRRRSVQDVLVDARIPAEQRDSWPLLVEAQERVLWVVGLWPPVRPGLAGPAVLAEPTSAITGDGL